MKAVGLYKYLPIDHPESLLDLDMPKPQASGRDLLVRVEAISVNPVDTKVRAPGSPERSASFRASSLVGSVTPSPKQE